MVDGFVKVGYIYLNGAAQRGTNSEKDCIMTNIYFPGYSIGANPIHEVLNWCKVRSIIRAIRRGDNVPAFVVDGETGNCNLITGTHRCAANDILAMLGDRRRVDFITLGEMDVSDELADAVRNDDYSTIQWLLDEQ